MYKILIHTGGFKSHNTKPFVRYDGSLILAERIFQFPSEKVGDDWIKSNNHKMTVVTITTVTTQLHLLKYVTTAIKAIYWSTLTTKTHKRSKLKIISKDDKLYHHHHNNNHNNK